MSRTERRRWLALALGALVLRAGLSVFTEFISIFPPHYYHDARLAEVVVQKGPEAVSAYPFSARAHMRVLSAAYAVWPHPLAGKLLNAALGAAAVLLFGLALRALFPSSAALATASLLAAWPSHVFYTSQNFKEAAVFFLLFAAFAHATARRAGAATVAAGVAALSALMYPAVAVGLAGAAGAAACAVLPSRRAAVIVLGCAAAAAIVAVQVTGALPRLDAARRFRQASDREYAAKFSGPTLSPSREIGTQVEPDARIDTWSGLLSYLPRAGFAVLFQPFPGLYPLDGKLGRQLAAAENLFLFLLVVTAAVGAARLPLKPAHAGLLGFFLALAAAAALFEFDLGSASRHKLLYLPMLFPFAAEELLRRRRA